MLSYKTSQGLASHRLHAHGTAWRLLHFSDAPAVSALPASGAEPAASEVAPPPKKRKGMDYRRSYSIHDKLKAIDVLESAQGVGDHPEETCPLDFFKQSGQLLYFS